MALDHAPIELGEGWDTLEGDAQAVVTRVCQVCLSGVRLVSDRQPSKLRVDEHRSGPPHIWLHEENPDTAWIVLDVEPLHWTQLAYQLGHELGHVLCNSWVYGAQLDPPSRWLEEAMVEAFTLRGLGLLADSWAKNPPFPHNENFAQGIRQYRANAVERYRTQAGAQAPVSDIATWFHDARPALDKAKGVGPNEGPGILAILAEYERDPATIADLGAVNRWPERSGVPIEQYLRLWLTSCHELAAPGLLPARLRTVFGIQG